MKIKPSVIAHFQWIGSLVLVFVALMVGILVIQPHLVRGGDHKDALLFSYLVAAILLPFWWMQTCGWWKADLLNEELKAKNDELTATYQRALPVELVMALFLAMDASRPAGIARANWGVSNNPSLVDVRTYMIELEQLVNRYGASWLIGLARTGRTPFDLDSTSPTQFNLENVPVSHLEVIRTRLRQSVNTTHS